MTLEDPLVFGRSPSRGTPSGSGMIDVDLIGAPAFAVRVVGGGFVYAGVNARLSEITGLASVDLVGRTPQACLPRDVADGPAARYRTCLESRQSCESELYLEGPAGAQDVVARIGGDEFAIIVAEVSDGDLPTLADRRSPARSRDGAHPHAGRYPGGRSHTNRHTS